MARTIRLFTADFETTVYKGQTDTEVWASALVELFTPTHPDSVVIHTALEDFLSHIFKLKSHCRIWFHNLKFDGSFIVDYLLRHGYKPTQVKDTDMPPYTFKVLISDMQRWYSLKIRYNKKVIEFRDSAKLAPLSVAECGDAYKTKYRKTKIEYEGFRHAHGILTEQERGYIANDVLVMKEVMELFVEEGHDRLTIGSCCVSEYKEIFKDWAMGDETLWDKFFPDLKEHSNFDKDYFQAANSYDFCKRFYHGAWCYKRPDVTIVNEPGIVVDKVSMYPSHMDSLVHPHKYAIGYPMFFTGQLPDWLKENDKYVYMIRFRCRFHLKSRHYPTVQIKNSFLYDSTKWRESSDFDVGNRTIARAIKQGKEITARPVLHLAEPDFELFMESYDIEEVEWMGGCYFMAVQGIFDDYIEKYRKLKETSKGGKRTIAKLFSNNLYGKLSTSDNSSYLVPYIHPEKDCVEFEIVREHSKPTFAVQTGLLVTAYSRCDIINAANADYDRFLYSDTDSEHLRGTDPPNVPIDSDTYGYYKVEGYFCQAVYLRQKTYAERMIHKSTHGLCGEKTEVVIEWEMTCAGMPKRSKQMFLEKYEVLKDFKEGTSIGGKLLPKRIKGGTILIEKEFTIHEK